VLSLLQPVLVATPALVMTIATMCSGLCLAAVLMMSPHVQHPRVCGVVLHRDPAQAHLRPHLNHHHHQAHRQDQVVAVLLEDTS